MTKEEDIAFPSFFPTMSRRRKPKNSGKTKKQASYGKKKNLHRPDTCEEQMRWDFVRALAGNADGDKVICDGEGCNEVAVAMWETKTAPARVWHGCEACQAEKNGDKPPPLQTRSKVTKMTTKVDTTSMGKTEKEVAMAPGKPSYTTFSDIGKLGKDNTDGTARDAPAHQRAKEALLRTLKKNLAGEVEEALNVDQDKIRATNQERELTPVSLKQVEAAVGRGRSERVAEDTISVEEEGWDLIKIMAVASFTKRPECCSTTGCELPACLVYASTASKERWLYCLDHQEDDFGGWPKNLEELPVKKLTKRHMGAMESYCSARQKPRPMPNFHRCTPKPSDATAVRDAIKIPPAPLQQGSNDSTKHPNSQHVSCEASIKRPVPHHGTNESTSRPVLQQDSYDSIKYPVPLRLMDGYSKRQAPSNEYNRRSNKRPERQTNNGCHSVTPSPHPPTKRPRKSIAFAEVASPPKVLHSIWQKGSEEIDTPESKIVVQKAAAQRCKFAKSS